MIDQSNLPGMMDGFKWWVGIVEDRKDPEKLSRMQVRMFIWHTDDKALIPTEKLFWAIPVFPTNNSNQTYTAKEGDSVFGFWIDTKDFQQPYIFGRFPDKPEKLYPPEKGFSDPGKWLADRPVEVASRTMRDGIGLEYSDEAPKRYPNPLNEQTNSRFARNEVLEKTPLPFIKQNIIKNIVGAYGVTWDEVEPDYAAVYPYNDSKQSESGHFFDIDDTRNKERITSTHRTGTMQEMRHTGSIHRKDMHHAIQLVHGTDFKNIRGNLWHTTERYTRFRSKGKAFVEINADTQIGVGESNSFRMDVGKDTTVLTGKTMTLSGKEVLVCGENVTVAASGTLTLKAPNIVFEGEVKACHITAKLFSGDVEGNLNGIAALAYNAQQSVTALTAAVGDAGSAVPVQLPIFKTPSCPATVKCPKPSPPVTINNSEAPIDEVITSGGAAADQNKNEQNTFKQRMDSWLTKITAPGSGGAGACWTYTMPDGTTGSLHTHHATGAGDVLTYFWCLGASSVAMNDGCVSGATGTISKRPSNYSCPI